MSLARKVYKLKEALPTDERFGLSSQLMRCATSVPSNIAEGAARSSQKDFKRFLEMALGSLYELETQLIICRDIGYLPESISDEMIEEATSIQKELAGFIRSLS
jgi:four helix bundle protein